MDGGDQSRTFAKRPSLQLVIPGASAELPRPPSLKAAQSPTRFRKEIGELPPNIFHYFRRTAPSATYTVMAQCDSVLIYGTKTGVELTSLGIPGDRRGRSVGSGAKASRTDVRSPRALPGDSRQPPWKARRTTRRCKGGAKKYAVHFFFAE